MKKKSQIQSQVFIYALSMIIIAMIFLFGYRSIETIIQRARDVELARFKTDLTETIETISYGSSINKKLEIPSGFTKVCIYDNMPPPGSRIILSNLPNEGDPDGNYYYLIDDAVIAGTSNFFLIQNQIVKEFVNIGYVDVKHTSGADATFICKPTLGGRPTINILGQGDHAIIKFID